MNILKGEILKIYVYENLSVIHLKAGDDFFKSVVIATPTTNPYLQVGNVLNVLFKETEVIIGKGDVSNISLQNKLLAKIIKITKGALLSKIELQTSTKKIVSFITSDAVNQLKLEAGEEVYAMIKTNEIMLSDD